MNKFYSILLLTLVSLTLAGCDTMTKQDVGTVTGSAMGALVGSRFGKGTGRPAAIAVGAIGGALLGSQIGKMMDRQDQIQLNNTLEYAPTRKSVSWKNPDTENRYTVTPIKTYKSYNTYCREYLTTGIINGKKQKMYGKACRQPEGSWKHK